MAEREFRVTWQRRGVSRRSALRQSQEAAQRLALVLEGRMEEARPDLDPDSYVCCDGSEDGCGGHTWREHWAHRSRSVPPLVLLRIDSREVGEWELGELSALPEVGGLGELVNTEPEGELVAVGEDNIPW